MCDKTAVFDDDSDGFDECDVLNTESPTRIFNMSLVNFYFKQVNFKQYKFFSFVFLF